MIKGDFVANGLVVTAFSATYKGSNIWDVVAKAAVVNTENGATYSFVDMHQWPQRVIDKVKELQEAMEKSFAEVYLKNQMQNNLDASTSLTLEGVVDPEDGIAAHLEDPKSI